MVTLNTVGPTLMSFGSEEQKDLLLPGILSGDLVFAIGYSEPSAGTDLASLRTRASGPCVLGGRQRLLRIDGQKIFTSNAQTPTDLARLPDRPGGAQASGHLDRPRPHGRARFLVDADRDRRRPHDHRDLLRRPRPGRDLVGGRTSGWGLITNQLNHERVALAAVAQGVIRSFAKVQSWAMETPAAGGLRVIDLPWVKNTMARAYVRISGLRLLNGQMVAALQKDQTGGHLSPADASAAKVHGTETHIEALAELLQVLGAGGVLKTGSPGALLAGDLEFLYRYAVTNTFGGGANEIQREIIAMTGLAMPRVRR